MLERLESIPKKQEVPAASNQEALGNLLVQLDQALGGDQERSSELVRLVNEYFAEHGGKLEPDFSRYINRMAALHPEMVVRREDPARLLHSLETGEPLAIRFREDAHGGAAYPNAGTLGVDASGLRIPYQRGFGKIGDGKIVLVVGFLPDQMKMHAHPLPPGTYTHYNELGEREKIRMVEGDVDPNKDLRFVSIRFPREIFPEDQMTEDELDNEQVFHISRLYSFNNDPEKENDH